MDRNLYLFKLAHVLCAATGFTPSDAMRAVHAANAALGAPLTPDEVEQTIGAAVRDRSSDR